jgi:hypothetical protein
MLLPHIQNSPAYSRFSSELLLKFIGRGDLNTWLPRSSHIIPLDFLFWDHRKGSVYVPPLPSTLHELPWKVRVLAPTFRLAMFTNVQATNRIKECMVCVGLFTVPLLNIFNEAIHTHIYICDQPRGLGVRFSDYWSWGTGFDSRFHHGVFSLKGNIPMATMVWVG